MSDPLEMSDADFERWVDRQHDLRMAIRGNKFDRVVELLEAGADAADPSYGLVAEAVVAETLDAGAQSAFLVRLLLEAGADPGLRNREGRTALEEAERLGNGPATELLREGLVT